jgi:hypothetical protein
MLKIDLKSFAVVDQWSQCLKRYSEIAERYTTEHELKRHSSIEEELKELIAKLWSNEPNYLVTKANRNPVVFSRLIARAKEMDESLYFTITSFVDTSEEVSELYKIYLRESSFSHTWRIREELPDLITNYTDIDPKEHKRKLLMVLDWMLQIDAWDLHKRRRAEYVIVQNALKTLPLEKFVKLKDKMFVDSRAIDKYVIDPDTPLCRFKKHYLIYKTELITGALCNSDSRVLDYILEIEAADPPTPSEGKLIYDPCLDHNSTSVSRLVKRIDLNASQPNILLTFLLNNLCTLGTNATTVARRRAEEILFELLILKTFDISELRGIAIPTSSEGPLSKAIATFLIKYDDLISTLDEMLPSDLVNLSLGYLV